MPKAGNHPGGKPSNDPGQNPLFEGPPGQTLESAPGRNPGGIGPPGQNPGTAPGAKPRAIFAKIITRGKTQSKTQGDSWSEMVLILKKPGFAPGFAPGLRHFSIFYAFPGFAPGANPGRNPEPCRPPGQTLENR